MFKCACCTPEKSYAEERNLYRHERKYNKNFIEPRLRLRLEYESDPKKCLQCNSLISFEDRVADRNKKFCNHSCAATYNNSGRIIKPEKTRNCLYCDGKLTQSNKKYCSHACNKSYNYKKYINEWLSGNQNGIRGSDQLNSHIRRYLLEQANHQCPECGWDKVHPVTKRVPLTIDHIDGNSTNNNPNNLKVLCPNCHSLTPTFGNLNKGNGREQRRLYRQTMKENGRNVA